MTNIIAGHTLNNPTPSFDPTVFTKISFTTTLPASIPINELVIHKHTMWRGLRNNEIAYVAEGTPIPVKGYRELRGFKSSPEFLLIHLINDFDFEFEITNTAPGCYLLARSGNLPISPIAGGAYISLWLTFLDASFPYSYSYYIVPSGTDMGKIKLLITKSESAYNTPSNAVFTLSLFAVYPLPNNIVIPTP